MRGRHTAEVAKLLERLLGDELASAERDSFRAGWSLEREGELSWMVLDAAGDVVCIVVVAGIE